jgi:Skp family chaperone for outer membrane proteins
MGAPDDLEEAYWGLLTIEERFLLNSGVGEHPNAVGCNQKFEAVKKAYDSEDTAFQEAKAEIEADLAAIVEMLKGTGAREDIEEIERRLAQVQEAMQMYDLGMEYKDQFMDLLQQTLDLLEIDIDTLVRQGEFVANSVDVQKLAACIKLLNAIAKDDPEAEALVNAQIKACADKLLEPIGLNLDMLIAQGKYLSDQVSAEELLDLMRALNDLVTAYPEYKAQALAMYNQLLDSLGITTDDLIAQAQTIADAVDVAEIAEMIRTLKPFVEELMEVAEDLPAYKQKVENQIAVVQAKLDKINQYLQEKGLVISDEMKAELEEIAEKIKTAVTQDDYDVLIAELMPIGEALYDIAVAVANLPEYEAAMELYKETTNDLMTAMGDRVDTLEQQLCRVQAKSVDTAFTTKLTFPSNKAKLTVSVQADGDADEYLLMVNGKQAKYRIADNKLTYSISNAKIGKKYKIELTAVVYYGNVPVYGLTTTKTVTPKVSLAKAKIKSAKAGKKSVTVKWGKIKNAGGYQISYKVGSKTKKVTVSGGSKVSKKIKGLQSGKKYTIKVRAYKKVNGKTYYGKWSSAKKVTVK